MTTKAEDRRRSRVRRKVRRGGRVRLSVFRSNANIYAQIIDDSRGHTVVSASSLEKDVESAKKGDGKIGVATAVGELIASRATKAGIKSVVFDRGAYLYHGRVKALAEAARSGGLDF